MYAKTLHVLDCGYRRNWHAGILFANLFNKTDALARGIHAALTRLQAAAVLFGRD